MTDAELRDAAVAELRLTTRGLKNYTPTPTSHWAKALALLEKIDVPVSVPPIPSVLSDYDIVVSVVGDVGPGGAVDAFIA